MQSSALNILNQHFDHIYVLTLKQAEARQHNIRRILNGCNWSFFYGCDKHNLDPENLEAKGLYDDIKHKATKRTSRSMKLGEVACSISHKMMYQDMLDNGYEHVLILEDDVLPLPERIMCLTQELEQLPNDWEVLMLGYYGAKLPQLKYRIQQNVYRLFRTLKLFNWHHVSKAWIDNICMQPVSESWYEIGKVLGTHAYAINRSAAQKFLDYQSPVILQADRIFNYYKAAHPLKAYAPKQVYFTLSELSQESFIQ
ncbi:glycosyltransferase family 25 protein [Alteromonas sediminis]|nr:glycosyltransferase family 25 protein [Alteromonas sediminis]